MTVSKSPIESIPAPRAAGAKSADSRLVSADVSSRVSVFRKTLDSVRERSSSPSKVEKSPGKKVKSGKSQKPKHDDENSDQVENTDKTKRAKKPDAGDVKPVEVTGGKAKSEDVTAAATVDDSQPTDAAFLAAAQSASTAKQTTPVDPAHPAGEETTQQTAAQVVVVDGIAKQAAQKADATKSAATTVNAASEETTGAKGATAQQSARKVAALGASPEGDPHQGRLSQANETVDQTQGDAANATTGTIPIPIDFQAVLDDLAGATTPDATNEAAGKADHDESSAAALLGANAKQPGTATVASKAAAAAPTPTPEARFADVNHPTIVTGVHGQLMPHGGTMQIRLDPPELGPLQVTVHMRDGVMSAEFQTSSEEATRLLSHSMSQLKGALESQGVNIERMQVQQTSRQEAGNNAGNSSQQQDNPGQQTFEQQQSARQEQQRKEMLQRMWRRLSGGSDPIDMMA